MKLAWHAIVRSEQAIIQRCVGSLLPYVDCAVVVDTGSTDDTVDQIETAFRAADKPLEIHRIEFHDFSQARNAALAKARASALPWEWALLCDADMELRVDRPDWLAGLTGPVHDMRQVNGATSYANRRLLARHADCRYRGVTHEYLDAPSAGTVDGAWFVDHADGGNRGGKLARDAGLLEEALKTETDPGLTRRYEFYLAQTYADLCDYQKAIVHYRNRVTLGGFAEECWYAQMRMAFCLRQLGDHANFLQAMLAAYAMRPARAETLYELARHYRERGDNLVSLLFSEPGLRLPYPKDDLLFVTDVRQPLKEEYSICAYYDDSHRSQGARVTNALALAGSEQAKFNTYWYLRSLKDEVTSFRAEQIVFVPPEGWSACNPSVVNHDGVPEILVRTVNYTITEEGRYCIRTDGDQLDVDRPIRTRNFIGTLADGFREVMLPVNWPADPRYRLVRGFEDSRLFRWRGQFWTLSTVRELTHEGWCEQILAPVDRTGDCWRYGNSWRQSLPEQGRFHEKNWMPWACADDLLFVYRLGTLLDPFGKIVVQHEPKWKLDHVSGGSQVVEIDSRTYLALVHEARQIPGNPNRYYQHRFVVFGGKHGRVDAISPPFFFRDRQIEFCAGLAYFPDKRQLCASFGVMDREAWLGWMDVDEVIRFTFRDAL